VLKSKRICKPRNTPEVFWGRVDWSGVAAGSSCWPWAGRLTNKGYGQLGFNRKMQFAHRVAYELANGKPVPPDLDCMHTCDNPCCVNPAHLRAATTLENMQDARKKGRIVVGSRARNSRLNEDLVGFIRAMRMADLSFGNLGELVGVHSNTIAAVIWGISLRHVRDNSPCELNADITTRHATDIRRITHPGVAHDRRRGAVNRRPEEVEAIKKTAEGFRLRAAAK
jgi:HNH endonuclease